MIINVDLIYPIGSVYMTFNNVNPSTLFGGTWERIGVGRTLISAGSGTNPVGDANTYTGWGNWDGTNNTTWFPAGEKGGCVDHVLTINEIPSHSHHKLTWDATGIGLGQVQAGTGTRCLGVDGVLVQEYNPWTNPQGGGQAHTNMPPYLAVYMWKRTA